MKYDDEFEFQLFKDSFIHPRAHTKKDWDNIAGIATKYLLNGESSHLKAAIFAYMDYWQEQTSGELN